MPGYTIARVAAFAPLLDFEGGCSKAHSEGWNEKPQDGVGRSNPSNPSNPFCHPPSRTSGEGGVARGRALSGLKGCMGCNAGGGLA